MNLSSLKRGIFMDETVAWKVFLPQTVVAGKEMSGGLRSAALHSGPSLRLLRHLLSQITCIRRAPPPSRVRGWTRLREGISLPN